MTPLPRMVTGDHALVSFLNQLIKCIEERTIIPGENIQVDRTPQGVRISARKGINAVYREMSVCYKEEGKEPREGFVMAECSEIYFKDEDGNRVDKDGDPL